MKKMVGLALMLLSYSCSARFYVNEYLAKYENSKDAYNKVEQWFNDAIRPGQFSDRIQQLKDIITSNEINKVVDSLKNRSFDDLAQFYSELRQRTYKRAMELAQDRISTDLSLVLNDSRFNQLSFSERSGIRQRVGQEIQSSSASSAYHLLKENSSSALRNRLASMAWQRYGKDCSYSVMPSAPRWSKKFTDQELKNFYDICLASKACKDDLSVFFNDRIIQ